MQVSLTLTNGQCQVGRVALIATESTQNPHSTSKYSPYHFTALVLLGLAALVGIALVVLAVVRRRRARRAALELELPLGVEAHGEQGFIPSDEPEKMVPPTKGFVNPNYTYGHSDA